MPVSGLFALFMSMSLCHPIRLCLLWFVYCLCLVRSVYVCICIYICCTWVVRSVYLFCNLLCLHLLSVPRLFNLHPMWLVCCLCLICSFASSVVCLLCLSLVRLLCLYFSWLAPSVSSVAHFVYILCDSSTVCVLSSLSASFVAYLLYLSLGCLLRRRLPSSVTCLLFVPCPFSLRLL